MTFESLHASALIVHENRVAVNRATFLVGIRESASLTITGKARNANQDTQLPHAVRFLTVRTSIKKKLSRIVVNDLLLKTKNNIYLSTNKAFPRIF